uniref:HSF-type DNA-binding domain-containing protein n=1 Tax=Ficedula albicollis TaxID=59894 RepID=A0A803VW05_FICAL
STFPAKLWRLVNSAGIRSVRWDSRGQGLLIDRSLLERELLSPGGAHGAGGEGAGPGPGPGPDSFQATRFGSFVRQLNLYGFHKVPGDAGGWLHFRNANFVRDRPELLLRIQRLTRANRQRLAAGLEVRSRQPSRFQQLHTERPLPAFCAGQPPGAAPSCRNLAAAFSLEASELCPGPSRGCAGTQESEASPPPAKKVCASSGLFGASPVEPSRELLRRFSLHKLTIPLVRIDPEAACRVLQEGSSCKSSEQHSPANSAASRRDSEVPPGPSRMSTAAQVREASPEPPEDAFVNSGPLGASSVEAGAYTVQFQPQPIIPPVPMDHESTLVTVPESSSCTFPEQHLPAYCPSATPGTSAPSAPAGCAGYAPWRAPRWLWYTPGEEELPPLDLDMVLETLEEMLSSSPRERSPSAQGNIINVASESSGGEPVNKAAAEGGLPGTESSGNSSQEPEELDIHLIYLARRAALRAKEKPRESL